MKLRVAKKVLRAQSAGGHRYGTTWQEAWRRWTKSRRRQPELTPGYRFGRWDWEAPSLEMPF